MTPFRQCVCAHAEALAKAQICPGSPEYELITEGRTSAKRPDGSVITYSWCGDFVSYVLMIAGATRRECLNRIATRGAWVPGKNISMLYECAKVGGAAYEGASGYARIRENHPGDIIVLNTDHGVGGGGHTCFLGSVLSASTLVTWDGNSVGGCSYVRTRALGTQKVAWVLDVDFFNAAAWAATRSGGTLLTTKDPITAAADATLFSLVEQSAQGLGVVSRDTNVYDDSYYSEA